jgi:hypothetical protein
VNSVSFGWIVFHTIHSQTYLFWLSKCMLNLKQRFFCVAYITYMYVVNFFENFLTCIFSSKNWSHRSYLKQNPTQVVPPSSIQNRPIFIMLYTFVLLGTELGGDLSILQECILCGHDCSYPMRLAGLCYQASEICQAEGSQGRVRNMVNGSYIEELQSSSDDYDKLVFQFTLCESIRFSKRISSICLFTRCNTWFWAESCLLVFIYHVNVNAFY